MKNLIFVALVTVSLFGSYEEFMIPCSDGQALDMETYECVDINETINPEWEAIVNGEEE